MANIIPNTVPDISIDEDILSSVNSEDQLSAIERILSNGTSVSTSNKNHKAYIKHKIPGRIRMVIPASKGNPEALATYASALSDIDGINNVEFFPETGSLVVSYDEHHEADLHNNFHHLCTQHTEIHSVHHPSDEIEEMTSKIEREAEFLAEHSKLLKTGLDLFKKVNYQIKIATDNVIDLKILLAGGLAVATFVEIGAEVATPMWVTLALFTVNHLIDLQENGVSAIAADLSNDNHTVPTDSSGNNGNFTGCATTMSVYVGGKDDSINWTYAVTKSTGVTCTEDITSRTQTITAMDADIGIVTMVASKSRYPSLTQVFSISKAKNGVSYSLNLSDNYVIKSSEGLLSPTNLTLTASKIDLSQVNDYKGRFKIYINDSRTATYISTIDEASITYNVTDTDTTIKCELYLAGGTTTLVDSETILVVEEKAVKAPSSAAENLED